MKNFWKFAAVGLAGYLVGFYGFKYKVTTMLESYLEVDKEDSNEEKEEEAQASFFLFWE